MFYAACHHFELNVKYVKNKIAVQFIRLTQLSYRTYQSYIKLHQHVTSSFR